MSIIICKEHGENQIVQMSKSLHNFFLNQETENIVKLIFNIEEIGEIFVCYFSSNEDVCQFKDDMNLDYFESEFSKISGNPGSCINCFNDYLKRTQSKIIEKEFNIK